MFINFNFPLDIKLKLSVLLNVYMKEINYSINKLSLSPTEMLTAVGPHSSPVGELELS